MSALAMGSCTEGDPILEDWLHSFHRPGKGSQEHIPTQASVVPAKTSSAVVPLPTFLWLGPPVMAHVIQFGKIIKPQDWAAPPTQCTHVASPLQGHASAWVWGVFEEGLPCLSGSTGS